MWLLMFILLVSIDNIVSRDIWMESKYAKPISVNFKDDRIQECQNCMCGLRNPQPRVVGGTEASPNAYPWLARLIYRDSFGCVAALINNRYVMSAAHCVEGFSWFMFRVTFGEHDRCDKTRKSYIRYVVKVILQDFSMSVLANDISLMRLSSPVKYSHTIRPICLPKQPDKTYTGTPAIIAGWGATAESGNWSCTLLEAKLTVLSNEDCKKTKYNSSRIMEVMMCAGCPEKAHMDSCTGASGGPLIAENEDGVYEAIGIVSWGYGCAKKGYPGVYTRVTKFLNWIKDNTEDSCYCKY